MKNDAVPASQMVAYLDNDKCFDIMYGHYRFAIATTTALYPNAVDEPRLNNNDYCNREDYSLFFVVIADGAIFYRRI